MVQIIGGGGLSIAFKVLAIEAVKLYESEKDWLDVSYQVWELSDEEFQKLEAVDGESWKSEYGWYRNCGCNQAGDLIEFQINGQTLKAFKNEYSWYHSEGYLSELEEDEEPSLPAYSKFSVWFSEYMGLSKPENLAYLAHSLAKHNNLSIAEFFKKYEG